MSALIPLILFAAAYSDVRCSETSIRIESNEGENVILSCTFDQSVTCIWKKNDYFICIEDRYRFVHQSKNEEKYNQNDSVDCHARFRYNDCSIFLFNYTSKVDRGKYQCTEYNNSEIHTFNLTTKRSKVVSTCKQRNKRLIYVTWGLGSVLVLLFVTVAFFAIRWRVKQRFQLSQPEVPSLQMKNDKETLETKPEFKSPEESLRSDTTGCIVQPYATLHLAPPTGSPNCASDQTTNNDYNCLKKFHPVTTA